MFRTSARFGAPVRKTMTTHIDTAMVLAAGLGTRMRPLSAERPKPLIEVAGVSLLDRVLDRLAEGGIARAVVNVHYKADMVEAALSGRTRPAIAISDERDALLETGGGVKRALPLLGDQPFVIQNADCFWVEGMDTNIRRLADTWRDNDMDALLLVTGSANAVGYDGHGDFLMDVYGRLTRRPERQDAPFVFAGASIAHPRLFAFAPDGRFSLNLLWDRAIAAGRLYGMRMDGQWMHVGTPDARAEAERRLQDATCD